MTRALAWVGSGLLFALSLVSVFSADNRDEGPEFVFGALLGRAMVALAIACALRALYLRLRRGAGWRATLWSPWVLVIAGAFGLLANVGRAADEASRGAATPESLVGAPPPGFTYQPLTGADAKMANDGLSEEGIDPSDIATRQVVRKGAPVAVVVFIINQPEALADTAADFRRVGGTIEAEEIDGEEVFLGRNAGGVYAGFTKTDDDLTTVLGAGEAEVRSLVKFYAERD